MSPYPFLSLPFELRQIIYRHYFPLEGGYVFQPQSQKLGTVDGQPPDHALTYTCRLIASETKYLPLSCNTISFSSFYHPEWSRWAGRFDYLLSAQTEIRNDMLISLRRFITAEIYSKIDAEFPSYASVLRNMVQRGRADHFRSYVTYKWTEFETVIAEDERIDGLDITTSVFNRAVIYALQLLDQTPGEDFARWIDQELICWGDYRSLADFLDQCYAPWAMPSRADIDTMGHNLGDGRVWSEIQRWRTPRHARNPKYRDKFRFSATAVAIRFLTRLPINKRLSIRAMVLCEDRVAVGSHQCHSLGLIPFCKENSRLRIELRVSMFTNVFQAVDIANNHELRLVESDAANAEVYELLPCHIPGFVGTWLIEALALIDAGMPVGSYKLVLDGEPGIDLCSDIFQRIVHRNVACQLALERCASPDFISRRSFGFYVVKRRFIEAMLHLTSQTSILRCNFNPGQYWDVDELIETYPGWGANDWAASCGELDDHIAFSMTSAMPDWHERRLENYERKQVGDDAR
ncbi:hypothetical protein FZEAL_7467 [Fusarium zealandicum]|uniref:Uncharacterized protein n=1 Tax=Fusarium zealandicum TaxID=1053134 RepID=A0A8H4UFY2_9HYPO|nr:hypothetical protein FZEAL_7467 [Fusarium zealandicum]